MKEILWLGRSDSGNDSSSDLDSKTDRILSQRTSYCYHCEFEYLHVIDWVIYAQAKFLDNFKYVFDILVLVNFGLTITIS